MYGKDDPFADPVVRCDSCQKLLFVDDLKKMGMCECGNRKVKNVQTLKSEEVDLMKERNVSPEFLSLFEEADNG